MVEVEHEPRSRATRDATLVPRLTDVSSPETSPVLPLSPDPLPHLPPHLCAPLPLRLRRLPDGLSGAPERGNPGQSEERERESEEEAGGGAGQAERRGA